MATHTSRNTFKLVIINQGKHIFLYRYMVPQYFKTKLTLTNMVYNIITKYVKTYLSLNSGSIKYRFKYLYTGLNTKHTYCPITKTVTLYLNCQRVNNPNYQPNYLQQLAANNRNLKGV